MTAQTPATHDVSSHLAVTTQTYDAEIRRFVPGYEAMLVAAMHALTSHVGAAIHPRILDLGAGTGAFTQAAMRALPGAHHTLLDADSAMIEQAKLRLGDDAARATFVHGSFFDSLPESDAAIASLSLHHVHEAAKKRKLYANIRASLAPGGVLVNADAMVPDDAILNARAMKHWAEHLTARGDTREQAYARFAQWADEDRYFSVDEELSFMKAAGFSAVDVAWRSGPIAVLVALR